MTVHANAPIDDDFWPKLREVAGSLGTNPLWLLALMTNESGIDSRAVNDTPGPGGEAPAYASGLIQFMPSTMKILGWTEGHEAFRELSATEQLDWVKRYFWSHRGKLNTPGRLYWATYYPATMVRGEDPDAVVTSSEASSAGERQAYAWNKGLDADHDGAIQLRDLDNILVRTQSNGRYQWAKAKYDALGGDESDDDDGGGLRKDVVVPVSVLEDDEGEDDDDGPGLFGLAIAAALAFALLGAR